MSGGAGDEARTGAQRLDVAVAPLPGRSRHRRGRLSALLVAAGLAAVVGVAFAGRTANREPETAVLPVVDRTPATEGTSAPPASPASRPPEPDERPERLPVLDSTDLRGAPVPVFHRRRGEDLLRFGWTPGGDAIERLPPVPDAFAGFGRQTAIVAVASPAGNAWALRGLGSFGGGPGDRVRLVAPDGTELWSATDAHGPPVAPVWSRDGSRVVVPGSPGTWQIVTVGKTAVAEPPLVVALGPPTRGPGGGAPTALEPAGFSVDGQWLYAIARSFDGSFWRPGLRFATTDGLAEPIDALPASGPEAVAADGRLALAADPVTGRRYASPNLSLSTGPTDVAVTEADGSSAFTVRLDAVLGLAWAGDGRLLALEADQVPEPSRLRLLPVDAHGTVGAPLLESGALTWAGLVGVRDGHALLAFATSGRDGEGMLAMLRLVDGATATLELDLATFADLQVGGWLTGTG